MTEQSARRGRGSAGVRPDDRDAFGRETKSSRVLPRRVDRRFMRHRLAMAGLAVFLGDRAAGDLRAGRRAARPGRDRPAGAQPGPELGPLVRHRPHGPRHVCAGRLRRARLAGRRCRRGGRSRSSVGVVLGAIAGYFGGRVDNLIMRFTDVMMTFPPVVIILTVAAIAGPGVRNTMLVIGLAQLAGALPVGAGEVPGGARAGVRHGRARARRADRIGSSAATRCRTRST